MSRHDVGNRSEVDYAFKKVFGSESNTDLLTLLLEAVLGFRVSAVEIINPFNDKETPGDKLSVLDIKARDASGRLFDVEMQMFPHAAIIPRLIYYWAKLYTAQLEAGEDFANLRPAYSICFINSRMFHRRQDVFLNRFGMVDTATGEVLSGHFGMNIVELPKFTREAEAIATPLESWCYYFEHGASLDPEHLPATINNPPMKKALEVLMRMSQDAQERERYESRLKYQRDMNQHHADAASAAASAMERGREKGREEGREEGMERGSLHGEIRGIQRMLKQPLMSEQELVKLSLEDLHQLIEQLSQRETSGK